MSQPNIFPALLHTQKTLQELAPTLKDGKHVVLLVSHETPFRNDTDREMPHRPESNFFYLTGCDIPGAAVTVSFTTPLASETAFKHTLYIPPEDPDAKMWSVQPPTVELVTQTHESHDVDLTSSLRDYLSVLSVTTTLHTLPQTDLFPPLPEFTSALESVTIVDDAFLPAVHRARLTKTPWEIRDMERACAITSAAHEVVMRELGRFAGGKGVAGKGSAREGGVTARNAALRVNEWEIESEGDAEAIFVAVCRRAGSKHLAYMPIIASGSRAATLHYICNHEPFAAALPTSLTASAFTASARETNGHSNGHSHDHRADPLDPSTLKGDWTPQVLLIDAGAESHCYGADITRTMPVGNGGRFTPEARAIYSLVLAMQKACEAHARPGVHWDELHLLAHKVLVKGFLELGIFHGGSEDEILASGVSTGFFPHGLGHSLGLDVHDVPSASKPVENNTIPTPPKGSHPSFYSFLRLRLPLQTGMIVTIEPGCYFSPHLLEPHRGSPYLDETVLARFEPVGGVRIEDVVVVETEGIRNLTPVGRDVEWIEAVCSGEL